MITSIQFVMPVTFLASIIAIFSHKFDDGFIGKICLSIIAIFSWFGFINALHGIMPVKSISVIMLSFCLMLVRHIAIGIFSYYRPRIMAYIEREKTKLAARHHK